MTTTDNHVTRTWQAPLLAVLAFLIFFIARPAAATDAFEVRITSPANGATVSGTVTVSATVNPLGQAAVAGVQFFVDNVALGTEDTSPPFSRPWDTTTAANGPHRLIAVARDITGLLRSDSPPVDVVADNLPPAVTVNQAGGQADPTAASPLNFTVVFSEPVTGFASGDVVLAGTAGGSKTVTVTGGPAAYDVAVTGMTSGTVAATVAAGAAQDGAGNTSTASTSTDNVVTFDDEPPVVAVTSPAAGTTVSGAVTVAADASDGGGVAGVQFFRDGTALGAEDTAPPYTAAWDTTSDADGAHTLTASARDVVGNTALSAAVTVTVSNAPPPPPPSSASTRFENADPSILYTDGTPAPGQPPAWWHGSRSRGWSGLTASFNRSDGARATFTFDGTSVRWIGFRGHWAGIARVSLDGGAFTEIDLFSPPVPGDPRNGEQVQAAVYEATGLAPGTHTLVVEATGRKHGAPGCDPNADPANCASDWAVVVDAFDVGPSVAPAAAGTRAEEAALAFSPGTDGTPWTQGDTSRPWSGGTAAVNRAAGARATFSFVGTSVRWIGFLGPENGIARVFLDGSFHAEVDTFSPVELQAVVLTATGLAAASHTVTIEVTGLKNAQATDSKVVLDALDVRARFEEPDPAVAYSAGWTREHSAKAWSGTSANTGTGTAALSQSAGEQATFTFTGTSVTWIGYRAPLAGIADVYLDGALAAQVDLYAAAEEVRVPVFTSGALASGTHTLRVVVTGQRNPSAIAAYVVIDAFDVTLPASLPAVQRRQENDPSVVYSPASDWTRGSRFRYDAGEFAMASHAVQGGQSVPIAGARATVRFTGTSVRWIGRRGFTSGVARVHLDSALAATIDTRVPLTSQEEFQAVLYQATGLAPDVEHTLEIELIGRNGEAPGTPVEHWVFLDAFDIY